MEKDKYKKDREALRLYHEKLRQNKQVQLIEIGKDILSGQNATELLSDPKKYLAVRGKQEEIKL